MINVAMMTIHMIIHMVGRNERSLMKDNRKAEMKRKDLLATRNTLLESQSNPELDERLDRQSFHIMDVSFEGHTLKDVQDRVSLILKDYPKFSMKDVRFDRCSFDGCDFFGDTHSLDGVVFMDCSFEGSDLEHMIQNQTEFIGCTFEQTSFVGSQFVFGSFNKSTFIHANLQDVHLGPNFDDGVTCSTALIYNYFENCDMDGLELFNCRMDHCVFNNDFEYYRQAGMRARYVDFSCNEYNDMIFERAMIGDSGFLLQGSQSLTLSGGQLGVSAIDLEDKATCHLLDIQMLRNKLESEDATKFQFDHVIFHEGDELIAPNVESLVLTDCTGELKRTPKVSIVDRDVMIAAADQLVNDLESDTDVEYDDV